MAAKSDGGNNSSAPSASWHEFLQTSTIHGLGDIVRSKRTPERIFLIILLLICNILSCYGVYQIIRQYSVRPVATSFFVKEADKLQLPDVTICPFNRLDQQFLHNRDVSSELSKFIEWSFFPVNPQYDFVNFVVREKARNKTTMKLLSDQLEQTLVNANISFAEYVEEATIPCDDVVQSCEQQYKKFNCCENVVPILTGFGRCYKIPGRYQNLSGYGNGVTLLLNLPLERMTTSENMLMNDGIMIKLTEPNKGYEFDAIFIPTGVHALLQLRATQLDFINDPPRYSCRNEEPGSDYAPLMCYQKCLLRAPHLRCNCRYIGLPIGPDDYDDGTADLPACQPKTVIGCIYKVLSEIYYNVPEIAVKCKEKCESRCNYWQYEPTVSHARYPSHSLARSLPPYDNETGQSADELIEDMRSRRIVLELFYDKLEYTLIKHFASMTVDQFIANIGGQMGLCMGGSILSIIHLLVFLCIFSRDKTKMLLRNLFPSKDDSLKVPNGGKREGRCQCCSSKPVTRPTTTSIPQPNCFTYSGLFRKQRIKRL